MAPQPIINPLLHVIHNFLILLHPALEHSHQTIDLVVFEIFISAQSLPKFEVEEDVKLVFSFFEERIASHVILDIICVQQPKQLIQIVFLSFLQKYDFLLDGLFYTLHSLVLSPKWHQPHLLIIPIHNPTRVKLHPTNSFLRIALKHPSNEASQILRHAFVESIQLGSKFKIVFVDIAT
jgi:hypothetical protein